MARSCVPDIHAVGPLHKVDQLGILTTKILRFRVSGLDLPASHAVGPLHKVDELELLKTKVLVLALHLVLWELLELLKLRLPLFESGRNHAALRTPLDH